MERKEQNQLSRGGGWNYGMIIGNSEYDGKGLSNLPTIKTDRKLISSVLGNKETYNIDFTLSEHVAQIDYFTNVKDIIGQVEEFMEELHEIVTEARGRGGEAETVVMFFLGQGGKVQGIDCILGVDGKPYPVNSILHKILDKRCAKKVIMILDFCRNRLDPKMFSLTDEEIRNAEETTSFEKVIRIWSTEESHKATALSGATISEALCEILEKNPKGVKMGNLEQILNAHWGEKQRQHPKMKGRVVYTCKVDLNGDYESTFPVSGAQEISEWRVQEDEGNKLPSIPGGLSRQNSRSVEVERQVLAALKFDDVMSLLEDNVVPSLVKDVALFILFMTSQDITLKHEIRKRVAMPVDSFTSFEDISLYISGLLTSGVDETLRAMIFVVGNTKVGKTSTMRTIQRFCQGLPKEDMPFLTDDPENHEYFETQVLEVINNVVMKESVEEEVALLDLKDVKMARFRKKKNNSTMTREVVVNVYDAGGQKEYFIASALFMKERVTFLVAFDGHNMQMTQVDGQIVPVKYQQTIGTYIDLICHNCKNPCIQLLATKMDSMDGSERGLWKDIWNKVADHLNSFSDETRQIVLASEILNVSARVISEDQMKKIISRTATLLLSEEITDLPKSGIPRLWTAVTSGNNSRIKVNISELQDKLDQLHKNPSAFEDKTSTKLLTELRNICKKQQVIDGQTSLQEEGFGQPEELDLPSGADDVQKKEVCSTNNKGQNSISKKQKRKEVRKDAQAIDVIEMDEVQSIPQMVLSEELGLILRTLNTLGNIIWFPKNKTMMNFIIPNPMDLTKTMRCVINHDIEHLFVRDIVTFSDLVYWGGLNEAALKIMFDRSQKKGLTQGFSKDDVMFFLEHLKLATQTENSEKEAFFFVPSLISENNEEFMRKYIKKMKADSEALKMIYRLPKNSEDSQMFQNIIPKLASDRYNFKNFGIEYSKGFAQKIEHRTIGEVAAMTGTLRWTFGSEPEAFDFLLVDVETNPCKTFFASHKELAIYVRACNRKVSEVMTKSKGCHKNHQAGTINNKTKAKVIMKSIFHKEVLEIVSDVRLETGLNCQDCTDQEQDGFFKLDAELCLKSQHDKCSNREHQVSKEQHALMSSSLEKYREGFSFKLLEDGLDKIPTMQGSEMLRMIGRNKVLPGTQIWIKRTKKDNWLAGKMPYAHVLVYIGQEEGSGEHEVVHVHGSKASCFRVGPLICTFERINIHEVLKEKDEVFFGHEIPAFGISANITEKVKKRAIACSDEPELQFHYTERDNCEGFANLIMGFKTSSNEQKAPWWMQLICCCVNPCYLCRKRTLSKVVMDRLRDKDLWTEEGSDSSCCCCC